jgi:subtilisin family serine protease
MKLLKTLLLFMILSPCLISAQQASVDKLEKKYLNWYNMDVKDNGALGASVNKTYEQLLKGKQAKKTVVVAVIDGGVDINHEDLKGRIWVNEKEIPNNNIDDDHNGYVDDINGWNFLGNANGENVTYETFEYTRIYKSGPSDPGYLMAKELYEKELKERTEEREVISRFEERYRDALATVKAKTGRSVTKEEDLNFFSNDDPELTRASGFLKAIYKSGFSEKDLEEAKKRNSDFLDKYLSIDFNPRAIVGDNPNDINETHYGNNNVIGPTANHGTSVAGIIAAVRGNGIGIDGIATNVKLMILRTVPDGDERDKDVALAIKYAVENGADIINMSFGKAISPQKSFVDDAIKLAERKNVLIVHAAGNDAKNIDVDEDFPSDVYLDKSVATNFISVGASSIKKNKELPAMFSNYGAKQVDLFAPGVNIISLDTNNMYDMNSGTSEAAPVVTGVAALILSYHPELKPQDIISIILTSSKTLKKKVYVPDLENKKRKKVKFATLSKSGAIINAFDAMKKAETYTVN